MMNYSLKRIDSVVDLKNNQKKLLISIRDINKAGRIKPDAFSRVWFNHIKFNPSGSRMLFFHRWAKSACPGHVGFESRVLTIARDGSDLFCMTEGYRASHYDWLDDEYLLIFLYHPDGDGYYLVKDIDGSMEKIGEDFFSVDGHCLYRPQKDWFLTDTYPQDKNQEQVLMLYNPSKKKCIDIGRFNAMSVPDPSMRCDLHSRWDQTGTKICFDSTHEGSRQMYMVDVAHIIK